MMPGERAVLEHLALELEILNRRSELKQAQKDRPVAQYCLTGERDAEAVLKRSEENRAYIQQLRFELQVVIERRRKPHPI